MARPLSDMAAANADGYNDGLVNSDSATDGIIDAVWGKPDAEARISGLVDEATADYRKDLVEDLGKQTREEMQPLVEFLAYGNGHRRPKQEEQALLDAYLSSYRAGLIRRVTHYVKDMRADGRWEMYGMERSKRGAAAGGGRMRGMAKKKAAELVPVAMEPELDTACEACETCDGSAGYAEAVLNSLRDLGASNPEDLIARNAKYVRGARKAGMSPGNAAGMIIGLSGSDPTSYTPRYQLEEGKAEEYVALDSRGKQVFGPTTDYMAARMHAERSGGVVKFVVAQETARAETKEPPAPERRAIASWANGVKATSRYGAAAPMLTADSSRETLIAWLKWNDPNGLYTDDANRREDSDPLTLDEAWGLLADFMYDDTGASEKRSAKYERCVRKVKAEGRAVNPWAVCTAAVGREPEPYTRKNLNWHRADNGSYYNTDSDWGRVVVKQRPSNKREGILSWVAIIKKVEVEQGETRAEVNEKVEKRLRATASTSEAAEVAIVERSDDDAPGGQRITNPSKDLHRLFGERYGRMGSEVFEVVILNINDEMIGKPVQVAMGQASGVRVEVEQVMAAAIAGRAQGGTAFIALHNHPGGTLRASAADKDLTKRIEAARKIAAPSLKFRGHYIVTARGAVPA